MEVGLKIITSDMARDMILSDAKARKEDPNIPPNRSMSNTVADNYARDMANGNWHPSWDAITISKNGVVKNGQHRLKAILKSGVSCPFLVITDAPNDFVGDIGFKRKAGDILTMQGIDTSRIIYQTWGIGAIRAIYRFYFNNSNATADECQAFAETPSSYALDKILRILSGGGKGLKNANIAAGLFGAWCVTRDDKVFQFAEYLKSGVNAPASVTAFRDWQRAAYTKHIANEIVKRTQEQYRRFIKKSTATTVPKAVPETLLYVPKWEDFLIPTNITE